MITCRTTASEASLLDGQVDCDDRPLLEYNGTRQFNEDEQSAIEPPNRERSKRFNLMFGMASLRRDCVEIFCFSLAGVELLDELGVRSAKRLLQRKVVRVESKEEEGWNERNERKGRLPFARDDDKNRGYNGDAPGLAGGAVASHALNNRLQDAQMSLNGGRGLSEQRLDYLGGHHFTQDEKLL